MKYFNFILAMLLLAGFTVFADSSNQDVDRLMLEQLRQLNRQSEGTRKKLDAVIKANSPRHHIHNPNFVEKKAVGLDQIKLPDKPTRKEVRQYISKIIKATKGQNSFNDKDQQVKMYIAVGHANLDLLLEARCKARSMADGRYHLDYAIPKLITERDKKAVISFLLKVPSLAKEVIKYGWEFDARKELVEGLKSRPNLPLSWIMAVSCLKDPDTYPDLIEYFIVSSNKFQVYKCIKDLPGIKLDDAIGEAWDMMSGGRRNSYERRKFAYIAAGYGKIDAVLAIIDMLKKSSDNYQIMELSCNLHRRVSYPGSITEIKEWLIKNRKNIVFDKRTGKYKLKAGK